MKAAIADEAVPVVRFPVGFEPFVRIDLWKGDLAIGFLVHFGDL
jgi:hypothetical protein